MTFARRVFTVAWIYGFAALLPMYFMEGWYMGRLPPALTHPEFYDGFIGVALAWQVLFVMAWRKTVEAR